MYCHSEESIIIYNQTIKFFASIFWQYYFYHSIVSLYHTHAVTSFMGDSDSFDVCTIIMVSFSTHVLLSR